MSRMMTMLAVACMLVLVQVGYAQQQETIDPGTIMPDDSVELENRIRSEKFDKILPRVMRDNNIDMWIHIMRSWTPDPLRFGLGARSGVFIFTDRGEDRIERAAFGAVRDPKAYDIVIREGMERASGGKRSRTGYPSNNRVLRRNWISGLWGSENLLPNVTPNVLA